VKPADISRIKTRNIKMIKSVSLQRTVRVRTSDTCIGNTEDTDDENGDLLADFHNILNRYFSQLLNARNVNDGKQLNH
jgi:hypothetical protein